MDTLSGSMPAPPCQAQYRRLVAPWGSAACGALLVLIGACRSDGGRAPATPVDRLVHTYDELRGGRFVIIADFEDPAQMELFDVVNASGKTAVSRDARHGRPETGSACLAITAADADDAIIVSNREDASWYLKRDWRAFDLLMASIHAPRGDLSLEVALSGGPPNQRSTVYTSLPLNRGWNAVRLDLAELESRVPLDDIREIRFSFPGLAKATTLYLDDLLLTNFREDVLGNSQGTTGGLYVQRAGRRLNVGAGGRFELTFSNGQVSAWHNLAADPHRLRNLVAGTTLGPQPVRSDAPPEGLADFSFLGKAVVARQRLVEASAVRVAIECIWSFADDPAATIEGRPNQQWRYTIYPTGQVYVDVRSVSPATASSPERMGLGVGFAGAGNETIQTAILSSPTAASAETATSSKPNSDVGSFAVATFGEADVSMLFVPWAGGRPLRIKELVDSVRRIRWLVAHEDADGSPEGRWQAMVYLASTVMDRGEAFARAREYLEAMPLRLELGSAVHGSVASREDGFDRGEGCYVISPDAGRVRAVLEGDRVPFFTPTLRIVGSQRLQTWVYLDHLILDRVGWDGLGDAVIQLPRPVTGRSLVDIHLRRLP